MNSLLAKTKCLALQEQYWCEGKIVSADEDGSYQIEFDHKPFFLLPTYYGVTKEQISIDDELLWNEIFSEISKNTRTVKKDIFPNILKQLGYKFSKKEFNSIWENYCKELFNSDDKKELNIKESYSFIRRSGSSAKAIQNFSSNKIWYHKLYWNQIRMGGRQPESLLRKVTFNDLAETLQIQTDQFDEVIINQIKDFQDKNKINLPKNLKTFMSFSGISEAVISSHPNNPSLILPGSNFCELIEKPQIKEAHADYAISILEPHQGDHTWYAVFNEGDLDSKIYVSWDDEDWLLTAPSISMFFWDLAQTGLVWYKTRKEKTLEKTDIGVKPA